MRVKLKEILDIKVGYQNRTVIKEDSNGDCRIIQSKDFNDDEKLNTANHIRFAPEYSPDKHFVFPNDVLFCAKGRKNFAYAMTEKLENTVVANNFFILRPNKKRINSKFLEWTLNHGSFLKRLKMFLQGTRIPFVSRGAFENLTIDVPDLKTQENIAKIISLAEKEKHLCQRIIELRDKYIQENCRVAIKTRSQYEK